MRGLATRQAEHRTGIWGLPVCLSVCLCVSLSLSLSSITLSRVVWYTVGDYSIGSAVKHSCCRLHIGPVCARLPRFLLSRIPDDDARKRIASSKSWSGSKNPCPTRAASHHHPTRLIQPKQDGSSSSKKGSSSKQPKTTAPFGGRRSALKVSLAQELAVCVAQVQTHEAQLVH